MTTNNIFNDISSIYVEEVFKPQLGKASASAPASPSGPEKKGGAAPSGGGEEGEMKRVRQAVYDIRYRARREDVPLEQAFNQYMSNTSMNAVEKKAVKEKLGIGPAGGGGGSTPVKEEVETKKYQVRVTDRLTGKSYVRMATREKINQLRANKNISSVEMTQYGSPYEGEAKKGSQTAKVTSGKGLDPVGKEDSKGDIDNDGIPAKKDKNDQYLLKRRKAIGNAMSNRKGKVEEGFSNWREDLREVVSDDIEIQKKNQVKEKKVNNYNGKDKCINLSPKLEESVIIESIELTEEFINESINVAAEYFFNEGLNDEGVEIVIEELGLDAFVEFIFELNESVITEKVETRLQKKAAGAPLKGPKGSKVQSSTNAALKKYGLTRKIDSEGPSSTVKKNRKVEAKPEVKAAVDTAKESQPKKRPVLDAIAREVNKGMKRHREAMSAARETGKTIGKAAKGASTVAKGFASGVSGASRLAARLVRGEEFEHVLEELTNSELYFLSNDLIEEVVTEVFYECIDEGYDIDEIQEVLTESLDISLESLLVEEDRYALAAATSKKNAKLIAKNKTAERRAEKTQKVKDTVKSVGDRIKSAGKSVAYGAGYVAGKAVGAAKKAGAAAAAAGEKAKEVAGKVSSTAKAGYQAGKGDDDSDEGTKSSGSYRIKYKTASTKKDSKKSGMLSRIGSTLKSGLKKAIASGARSVSRGARNVARRMEEEVAVIDEKITAKTDMGTAIKDFYSSQSPQLAGRTKEERRKAAIAAVLTARRGGKKLGEAVTQLPGRETTPPSGTTAKQDDIQRKQMIANRQKMIQKQQMLQRQQLAQQKQGKLPLSGVAEAMDQEQQQVGAQQQQGSGTEDKKAEMLRKQQLANRQKMIQKKQMLQRQELALQKQGKLPMEMEEVEFEIEEGMTMKDFKANRRKLKRREASADAKKRGHVGKEWYNSGRTYSPDEAKSNRSKLDDEERSTRHRSSVDPEGDDSNYSADKTKNPKKQRKQDAMGEEFVSELNRYEKETGKDYKTGKPSVKGGTMGGNDTRSQVMRSVMKSMGSGRLGVQPRGKKKEPGKKPPKAGEYGAPASPAQKVAKRRAAAQRAQDNMSSRFD